MKVLWIALVWPEPESSAAGVRTFDLIMTLKKTGYDVQVCSPGKTTDFRKRLEECGIKTNRCKPNDSEFDSYVSTLNPEIVFFDRFMAEEQFAWRVREQCPNAVRILDTVDLHSLRRTRQNTVLTKLTPVLSNDTIRELSAIFRSDVSLIISEAELQILSKYGVPNELVTLCGLSYDLESVSPADESNFYQRANFVTIGNFNHVPNADSIRVLKHELWKAIRDKVSALNLISELHVYGAYPSREFLDFDDPDSGFRVKGWSENSVETLKSYRVNLAPLRFGAGVKGKIADGWAAGVPAVTTSIGAEGMRFHSTEFATDFGGVVEDDWSKFAAAAANLYTNPGLWIKSVAKGQEILSKRFDRQKNSVKFLNELQSLRENFKQRREQNLFGSMLWYQQHRSTEFFSRWIEVKNKLLEYL